MYSSRVDCIRHWPALYFRSQSRVECTRANITDPCQSPAARTSIDTHRLAHMACTRLIYAAAACTVFLKDALSHKSLRNPSLRSNKPSQQDLPLSSSRSFSGPRDETSSFRLGSAAARSRTPPTCRCEGRSMYRRSLKRNTV